MPTNFSLQKMQIVSAEYVLCVQITKRGPQKETLHFVKDKEVKSIIQISAYSILHIVKYTVRPSKIYC